AGGGVDVRAVMAAPSRLRSGRPVYYGLGLAVRRYRGLTVLCHTGSQPGYKAHVAYVPEVDVGLVILSNREDTRPAALAASLMDRVIASDFPGPNPVGDAARRLATAGFRLAELRTVEGTYGDSWRGAWVTTDIR